MKFISKLSNIRIAHSDLKAPIEFVGGKFETTDKKEIAAVKQSSLFGVSVWEDKEEKLAQNPEA